MKTLTIISLFFSIINSNAQVLKGSIHLTNNKIIPANKYLKQIPVNPKKAIALKNKKPTYQLDINQDKINHIDYDFYGHKTSFYRFRLKDKWTWARLLINKDKYTVFYDNNAQKESYIFYDKKEYKIINPENASRLLNLIYPNEGKKYNDLNKLKQ